MSERKLTYVIVVDDAQATAKVTALEQRMTTSGAATGKASAATTTYGTAVKATAAEVQAASTATDRFTATTKTAAQAAAQMSTALKAEAGSALAATDALLAKINAQEAAVAATAASAATTQSAVMGLAGAVSAAAAEFMPVFVIAELVAQMWVGWVESAMAAALATETLGAKQDTLARASKLAGVPMKDYAEAVKFLNEQFQRTPAFVDHATDALEHWKIALGKGPMNAQLFAGQDLSKNIAGASETVQTEVARVGLETVGKAMDQLRQHTVLGDAAFAQWTKDLGLSSVTVGVLREQVQAEEKAQQNATATHLRAVSATERQIEAEKRKAEALAKTMEIELRSMARVTERRNRAGGITLQEDFPFVGPIQDDREVLGEGSPAIDKARLANLNLEKMAKPWIDKQLGPSLGQQIGRYFSGGQFGQTIVAGMTGGGGMKGAMEGVSSQMGETFTQSWGKSIAKALPGKLGETLGGLVGPLGALAGPLLDKILAIGGPSKEELAGRSVVADFSKQFASTTDMINRIGDAYRANGKTAEEAQAAIERMWAAEKQGADATRAALAAVNDELKHQKEVTDAIHNQGFQSQDEIKHAADITNEAYAQMLASGQYTEAQVEEAYRHYQELLSQLEGAAGEAAKAWLKAHQSADDAAQASKDAMKSAESDLKKLVAKRDTLVEGIASEAPEQVMGVIEAQQRGQLEVLDNEIEKKAEAYAKLAEETGQKMADAIVEALKNIKIDPVHVPVIVDAPRGSGSARNDDGSEDHDGNPTTPMKYGGYGYAPGPMTFSTKGNEYFAFSGEGKKFGNGAAKGSGVTVGAVNIAMTVTENVSRETLKRNLTDLMRTDADVYEGIGVIAERRVA